MREEDFADFCSFGQLTVASSTAALLSGYLSIMICHRFVLPLPVFSGSNGRIRKKLSLQQFRRTLHIHTPLLSANAVILWCMECIWISYYKRLLDKAPVCMGARLSSLTVFSVPVSLWNPRACSGSGRLCMHASIPVPRGGAWSASHPWSPELT